jgi:hypothetical protein
MSLCCFCLQQFMVVLCSQNEQRKEREWPQSAIFAYRGPVSGEKQLRAVIRYTKPELLEMRQT